MRSRAAGPSAPIGAEQEKAAGAGEGRTSTGEINQSGSSLRIFSFPLSFLLKASSESRNSELSGLGFSWPSIFPSGLVVETFFFFKVAYF